MNTTRFLTLTLFVTLCAPAFAQESPKSVVVDKAGRAVKTTTGGCVITKWDGKEERCADKPAAKPAPVAAPKPVVVPPAVVEPARPIEKMPQFAQEQRSIYFDFDKDILTAEARQKLDSLAANIRGEKSITKATVVGYADIMGGKSERNVKLSERRAKAVHDYIASRVNVPTETASVRGLGATDSQTECSSKLKRAKRIACLAKDRRVEIELTTQQ